MEKAFFFAHSGKKANPQKTPSIKIQRRSAAIPPFYIQHSFLLLFLPRPPYSWLLNPLLLAFPPRLRETQRLRRRFHRRQEVHQVENRFIRPPFPSPRHIHRQLDARWLHLNKSDAYVG